MMMNDYVETPEGQRVRWIRPSDLAREAVGPQGQPRHPGVVYIDQWLPPEPPEAA